jgi:hypothetical protein
MQSTSGCFMEAQRNLVAGSPRTPCPNVRLWEAACGFVYVIARASAFSASFCSSTGNALSSSSSSSINSVVISVEIQHRSTMRLDAPADV